MKKYILMFAAFVFVFLPQTTPMARAQAKTPRFEIGAQYEFLNFEKAEFLDHRHKNSGIGARFTFNFNKFVAAEAEIDYFPKIDTTTINFSALGPFTFTEFGRKTLGVFGVKAGLRKKKFGVFGKARPGFIHFSEVPEILCIPFPIQPCLQPARTNFAFDVGGVFEYYVSRKLALRFDVGDTIIHHKRIYGTTHQLQSGAGVVLRF
jgi:outer membrane protein with beta-barrel domain